MQHGSAEPSASERTEADGEESKSHVGALLFCGRELGNVFVILGGLGDFSQSEDENGDYRAPIAGPEGHNQPGESGDQGAENYGPERRDLANEVIPGQGEADHYGGGDGPDGVGAGIGVGKGVDIGGG